MDVYFDVIPLLVFVFMVIVVTSLHWCIAGHSNSLAFGNFHLSYERSTMYAHGLSDGLEKKSIILAQCIGENFKSFV